MDGILSGLVQAGSGVTQRLNHEGGRSAGHHGRPDDDVRPGGAAPKPVRPRPEAARASESAPSRDASGSRPAVRRRVGTMLLLMTMAVSLLISVPGLRPVVRTIAHINPVWLAAAIALELASDVSFVILFRLFFDRIGPTDARALAWTEQASGALIPGGGAGGLAIGGWLMHLAGAPTDWIIRRSGGLFFLTTAVNGFSVIGAGLLLGFHLGGHHSFALTLLPAALATAAAIPIAALPRLLGPREHVPRWILGISDGIEDAEQTTFQHPSWRLLASFGYLGFDMAVLWVTLHAVGEPVSIPALILAYNIGYVGNALPIPGGIGVLDAGLVGALLLYGVAPLHVTAAVLVYHAIALWVPGLGGTLAYLRVRSRLVPGATVAGPPVEETDDERESSRLAAEGHRETIRRLPRQPARGAGSGSASAATPSANNRRP